MSTWHDVNRDSWTFTRKGLIVGYGGGIGDYRISYAINEAAGPILNGRVTADVRLVRPHLEGAGLVCRADRLWTFVAFYTAPETDQDEHTFARFGVFKQGVLTRIATAPDPIQLSNDWNHVSLEFYSGHLRGEIRTPDRSCELTVKAPHIPFPGWAGVVKLYGAEVLVRNVLIARTEMPFATSIDRRQTSFDYDVFLCHSGADKPTVRQIADAFHQSGITYWLDEERIQLGDQITQKIEEGLQKSRYIVPCISENFVRSGWTRAEYGPILNAEFSGNADRVVIPLKLDDRDDSLIPILLRDKRRVSYRNRTEFLEFIQFLTRR